MTHRGGNGLGAIEKTNGLGQSGDAVYRNVFDHRRFRRVIGLG